MSGSPPLFRNLPERLVTPVRLARLAGDEILRVCGTGCGRSRKADGSIVTDADIASHELLRRELAAAYPGVPVISEEGGLPDHAERTGWERFLLVDPLDGTKQFVRGNGEFAVNIALVEGTRPMWGVLHLPALGTTYAGGPHGLGAYRVEPAHRGAVPVATRIHAATGPLPEHPVVLKAHSRKTPLQDKWLAERSLVPSYRPMVGASLKFCMVAEGTAHLAPCMHPTWEWDTAAGQALVEGAGGAVTDHDGNVLTYNKPVLLNPWYIARANLTD